MGADNRLPWSAFWSTLIHQTEVGQWGHTGRFRPAYYAVRVAETVVFGNDPKAWYAAVLVAFACTCALVGYTTATWLSAAVGGRVDSVASAVVVGGAAVAAYLAAGLFAWSGIVGRLGPAEQLALLATGVLLLSLTKLSLGFGRWWWIPALLGVTTATFAKETFSSLCLMVPLVGIYSYLSYGRRRSDLIAGALGLMPAASLAAILAPTLMHNQHDVYGVSVGSSRLSHAVSALAHSPVRRSLTAGAVLLLAWVAVAVTIPRIQRRVAAFVLAMIICLVACVLLDDWFYGGSYPLPRYHAMPDLAVTLEFVGAACLSIAALRRSRGGPRPIAWLAVASVAVSSYCLIQLALDAQSNLRLTHAVARQNALATNEYQQGLSRTLADLRPDPNARVAVVATVGVDYELAFAVLNELARRTRDRYREYLIVDPSTPSDALLAALTRVSDDGSRDWHARPVKELTRRPALCVFLNVQPRPLPGCRRGHGVRVVAQGM